MLGKNHLHIDEHDQVGNWLSRALASAEAGSLTIDYDVQKAVEISINNRTIAVDLLAPQFFRISDDETGLFDKLKTATEFGRKLSDNNMTLSFLRKGKEAVRLGKDARPTFSKLISRSSDVQLTNVMEFNRLKNDMKSD